MSIRVQMCTVMLLAKALRHKGSAAIDDRGPFTNLLSYPVDVLRTMQTSTLLLLWASAFTTGKTARTSSTPHLGDLIDRNARVVDRLL
eukprot:4748037-Amphidinium_carterae.2